MNYSKLDNCSLEYSTLRLVNYSHFSSNTKERGIAYTHLLNRLKDNKAWPSFYNNIRLIASNNNDIKGDLFKEITLDKPSLDSFESARQYFLQKSEPFVINKILKYFDEYYRLGVFSEIITVVTRFMGILKSGLNKEEFHQILIKFVFSCIVKNQFDVALAEIAKLKGNFDYYDLNIYIL